MHHDPVLLAEVLSLLRPRDGDILCDVTLGLGGHSEALLLATGAGSNLIAFDADRTNLEEARKRLMPFGDRVTLHHANFRDVSAYCLQPVDVLLADLGLSSPHIDDPQRGFTFRADGPLDLRFDQDSGQTASDWIAEAPAQQIADVLRGFGELREAYRLALAIEARKPRTTGDLRACVEDACGWRAKSVLPQVFQALRILVNQELASLQSLLLAIPKLLAPGGRCGIISYHSLEDRMVKQAFRALAAVQKDPETGQDLEKPTFTVITKKAVTPSADEVSLNPRARSAKLRVIEKKGKP